MLSRQPSWKSLLIQAFEQTPVESAGKEVIGLVALRRYVYQSLKHAGIENRNPFRWWQLLRIRRLSGGQPQQVRNLCIDCVQSMGHPAMGFRDNPFVPFMSALLLCLVVIMLPQTATTSRVPSNAIHVLKYTPPPIDDIDLQLTLLPLQTDYHEIASTREFMHLQSLRSTRQPADGRWIELQSDQAYSLQLASSSDHDRLVNYCRKHQICEQTSMYSITVSGQKVYRLLYGVFENHHAARIAKSALPEVLRQSDPWARQFKKIKQEL